MEKKSVLKIYKPSLDDLWFKEKMLCDKDTMSYNHMYGGTVSFPKEKWGAWYNRWMNDDKRYYRYLKNDEGDFIGEIAYCEEDNRTICSILILAEERGKGYGTQALRMLCEIAKANGIKKLYDDIAIDNPGLHLFLKEGFAEVSRNEEAVAVKKML